MDSVLLPDIQNWIPLDSDEEDDEATNGFSDKDPTEDLIEEIADEMIAELCLGLCFQTHRSCKAGTLFLDETDTESQKQYELIEQYGLDVFGQVPMKKSLECICPNCSRNMAASRFAPHLEKCMGMGRNSSRIASRRIANSGKRDSDNESDNDNDNDNDWSYNSDRKAKKMKKDKSGLSPRRGKHNRFKNGDIPSVGSLAADSPGSTPAYELMTLEERKTLLLSQCGVISEHTKKLCTRSHKCPQHSDEQRHGVRLQLLGHLSGDGDEVQVDIDSYEDGDSQVLRDTLHWDAVSNPSPADSTSTTTSTGSRKRSKKLPYKKKKKSGLAKAQRPGTPNSLYEFS